MRVFFSTLLKTNGSTLLAFFAKVQECLPFCNLKVLPLSILESGTLPLSSEIARFRCLPNLKVAMLGVGSDIFLPAALVGLKLLVAGISGMSFSSLAGPQRRFVFVRLYTLFSWTYDLCFYDSSQ